MELTPLITAVQHQLAQTAAVGGEETRELAERLIAPLDSALRLTLLEALSLAAEEITADLAPGSVDLRVHSGEPEFFVTRAPQDPLPTPHTEPPTPPNPQDEESTLSRVTLRLPEAQKQRAETAAAAAGLSVNAWLVRAVSAALVAPQTEHEAPGRTHAAHRNSFVGWLG